MGLIVGAIKLIVKSPFTNTSNMKKFGEKIAALLVLGWFVGKGQFDQAIISFIEIRLLPPFTLEDILIDSIVFIGLGSLLIGPSWIWGMITSNS